MVVPTIVVLMTGGFQVPAIGGAFVELPGNGGGVLFRHKGPIGANVDVTGVFKTTVTLTQEEVSHGFSQRAK